MTLVRWSPARNMFGLRNEIDHLFNEFFDAGKTELNGYGSTTPAVNVEETDNEYLISAEVPGMKKDEIKIVFQDNVLSLSGEKKAEKDYKEGNYHRYERSYGKFCRTIAIPSGVKLDKIDAQYKDGILNVTIPKAEEAKPKQIEVKVH